MKRLLRVAVIGCTLFLLGWLFVVSVLSQPNPGGAATTRLTNPIVGIWQGEHGVILDLRADGSARSRSIDDATTTIHYFRYRLHGDEFSVDYSAKPDEYMRRLKQAVLGITTDNYGLRKLSNSELQLINSTTDETLVFTRTEDSVLAAVP